jgi:hypothetical protein
MTIKLTTLREHSIEVGDSISITRVVKDTRWFVVVWAWLLRRPVPTRKIVEIMTVRSATSTTMLAASEEKP